MYRGLLESDLSSDIALPLSKIEPVRRRSRSGRGRRGVDVCTPDTHLYFTLSFSRRMNQIHFNA